jgi:broad specificity phosphatase PhoE
MKILFIRHGESMGNIHKAKTNSPDYLNGLTQKGIEQIQDIAKCMDKKITAVYSSHYNRAVLSAETFVAAYGDDLKIRVDERLREVNYGIYGDDKNNPEMIEAVKRQIAGDYEVRFGRTGENKREIVTRFFKFLLDVFKNHKNSETIAVFSHGRAISIIEFEFNALNNIDAGHSHTANGSVKEIELTAERVEKLESFLQKLNAAEILRRERN